MLEFRLFAHGAAFDVDAFLASTTLIPDFVWRHGDQRRYACIDSRHVTSGVEFLLGDGATVPLPEQECIAVAYLETHRDALRALARCPGVDAFILGLQYRTTVESNVIGFSLGPSGQLMRCCSDVGCEPVYYVTLERLPEAT